MMSRAKITSYSMMAAILAVIIWFRLGHVLLAALFSYMILDLSRRKLQERMRPAYAKASALLVLILAFSALFWMLLRFIKQLFSTLPKITGESVLKIVQLADERGIELPFENVNELKAMVLDKLFANAHTLTVTSTFLTKEVFHIVIAIAVAILFFMSEDRPVRTTPNMFEAVRKEFNQRVRLFMTGFEKVFGAQVIISALNTIMTAIFLSIIAMPYAAFLITTTFVLGLLPIIGNLLTNTLITMTALTMSLKMAALALLYLIFIHKLEYFLNSRIMGSSINVPMWQTLLAILAGEIIMGVTGILLAPAILHYIKAELQAIPCAGTDCA